jgi:hypothetical protein
MPQHPSRRLVGFSPERSGTIGAVTGSQRGKTAENAGTVPPVSHTKEFESSLTLIL